MNATAPNVVNLRALLESAERAIAQKQLNEAGEFLEIAYKAAPENTDVLSARGIHALHCGRAQDARDFLERAVALDSKTPRLFLNLAAILRDLGDREAEMQALQRALTLDPYFYLAIFQKASLLELDGRTKEAAGVFQAALSSIPAGTQLPIMLQPIIEHARQAVRDNSTALDVFLQERLRLVREQYGDAALDRVDDCLAAVVGKRRIYVQQPMLTHFPRLPAIQFYKREDFDWLADVEAATDVIRFELQDLLSHALHEFFPYVAHPDGEPLNQWKELNRSARWSALFLYKDGERLEENIARCPKTVAALAKAPQVVIPNRGPTAFFSRLEPHTRIPPHTGSTNTRLTVHIPLIVPPNCGFRVGSEVRQWQPGIALIFDDTIEHEAWNDSSEPRVILIFDIWNPLLTEAEVKMMTVATAGIGEFYDSDFKSPLQLS